MELEMRKQNTDYTVQVISSPSTLMDGTGVGVLGADGEGQSPNRKALLMTQVVLRILVVAFTLAAIVVTITAKQTVNVGRILTFKGRYNYSSALRFQVGANAVVCAFTFLSLLLFPALTHPKSDPNNSFFYLLLHDMVLSMLVISGCAAGTTVGYLAKNGQEQGSWIAFCNYLDKFCDKLQLALALAFLAFFCMFVLTIMDASKLKSRTTHCH